MVGAPIRCVHAACVLYIEIRVMLLAYGWIYRAVATISSRSEYAPASIPTPSPSFAFGRNRRRLPSACASDGRRGGAMCDLPAAIAVSIPPLIRPARLGGGCAMSCISGMACTAAERATCAEVSGGGGEGDGVSPLDNFESPLGSWEVCVSACSTHMRESYLVETRQREALRSLYRSV